MLARPRRNRRAPVIRESHTETWLAPSHFVYPLFIHSGPDDIPVASMPGRFRLSLDGLMKEVEGAVADGIGMIEVRALIAVAFLASLNVVRSCKQAKPVTPFSHVGVVTLFCFDDSPH